MDQWWKRCGDIDMGDYKRSDVEDITGCIPLLLDKCLVSRKIDLNAPDLREIYHEAVSFVHEIRTTAGGKGFEWQWYVRLYSTLQTLLTFQVYRVREGLFLSPASTRRMARAPQSDRPSVFLSER
jgi:hypothetical protein